MSTPGIVSKLAALKLPLKLAKAVERWHPYKRGLHAIVTLVAIGILAACATPSKGERLAPLTPDQMASIQKLVTSELRDPKSAQFRNVRALGTADTLYVCGEVNARNSFGGYVGYIPFVVSSPKKRGRVTVDMAREASDAGLAAFALVFPICR